MKLTQYRIRNFRSINDSGLITVGKSTALVGRNESGKSNLLLALASLKPAGGIKPLTPIKDFPRHRKLTECTDGTPVVDTEWEFAAEESAELARVWPRAVGIERVSVSRNYKGKYQVGLSATRTLSLTASTARAAWQSIGAAVEVASAAASAPHQPAIITATQAIGAALDSYSTESGPKTLSDALTALRAALNAAVKAIPTVEDSALTSLQKSALADSQDAALYQAARTWVVAKLPTFVLIDEYPEFEGHQDLGLYAARKAQNTPTAADLNFEKLCKVSGLDPAELVRLQTANDAETRNQLANRAGAVVTAELRRLWKDRPLKVRFGLDAQHLHTIVSDPNKEYDVEVNLDERSRGLRWFFSFYITFSADTQGGVAENAVLLLDEPGLFLHARSQADLLRYIRKDLTNQVLFTTHSPFMVPVDALSEVRTVSIDQDSGTRVSDTPTGDSATLFPLQAALGFDLAQSLFVGPNNMVVEGVTDYWYLSAISEVLRSSGKAGLPVEVTITPAGGAQKVGYLVALLTSERLQVIVLLDDEDLSRRTRDELIKAKLIRDESVLFTTSAFDAPAPKQADIEDLFEPSTYERLVLGSYAKELTGKTLTLNASIPRIVKRYEEAFKGLGIEFHKTRPARLFLSEVANNPSDILTAVTLARFEKLFQAIGQQFARQAKRAAEPFSSAR